MLLRASRGAWRLKPPVASLCGEVANGNSVPSARCLSSAGSEEWGAQVLRREGGKTANQPAELRWRTTPWEEKMLVALRAYKEINGDTLVPRPFVIPSGDARWPRVAWGYALGRGVNTLRLKWDEIIMPALRHFYAVNGHTDVPWTFVVPDGDDAWPRLSWNWSLGFTIEVKTGLHPFGTSASARNTLKQLEKGKMSIFAEETLFHAKTGAEAEEYLRVSELY
ncbi:hypothetical protein PF007_g26528 [Phytophthora fragariae]|uniref:Helicase-associated domain-containing protein n=1 Tax=Phytophthora fragariae TaxID=53985 RepID=A0A6A3QAC4_9STRA|nr:hypothetical protein PF007_g26528 [Phytophthora fragariae]